MPELPEVETVMRGIEPAMTGYRIDQLILNRPDLRWPFPGGMAERVSGAKVCLLYTSPSPRDGLLSRMPSSA